MKNDTNGMINILKCSQNISLEMLENVAKITSDYTENEWHNEPKGFESEFKKRSIFATRIIPIHNYNGYAGSIYQFLWRQNMDYHQLITSEPQPMQQSAPTDYAAQLSVVKTLPELFDFRAKLKCFLKAEIEDFFGDMTCKSTQPERVQALRISELEFFIARVESQIKALENSGVFLAAVDGRGAVRDSNDLILEKKPA